MSHELTGIVGIGIMLVLFLLGMPIAFSMAAVGLLGITYIDGLGPALYQLGRAGVFDQFASYPLTAIPMFILMGSYAYASGISRRLFDTTYIWVGQYRGGLTMATVLACSGFAAICGSTAATAATMGKVALPEMKRYNYNDTLATGTVAAAGTLGILIPPSTVLIVYGYLTEESLGKLFIAGVIPGVILSLFFVATVFLICLRRPDYGPPGAVTSWKQKLRSLTGVSETAILFALVIGGLFLGWFSPTQAGAIGTIGTLLIGLARRELNWQGFLEASKDGLRTACMVIFIVAGATVFGKFMVRTGIPFLLVDWMGGLAIPNFGIATIIVLIFFIGGFFMDAMALIVLLIPILFPLLDSLGINLIWFGVIVVLVGEMGVITPPVGVNVFVIKGIAPEIPIETIFKGIFPFLIALIIFTIILMIFPEIATFLPGFTRY